MKTYRLAIFFSLLFSASVSALQVNVNGFVQSDTGTPLASAEILINDKKVTSDASGHFSASITAADIFVLKYSARGYFPMVHSFSALDIEDMSKDTVARLPDVSLVKHKKGRILLAFGGDTMMGRRFSKPSSGEPVMIRAGHKAEDTAALLRYIAPYLQLADYTSVNLEAQVMEKAPETHAPKLAVFFTPPEALSSLAEAGIDHVTLGNNHMFDYLGPGMDATIENLNASPLAWSGGGRTEVESLRAHRTDLGGNPLSFLGYVGWSGNFTPNQTALGTEKGGAALGSIDNIRQTVGREVESGYRPVVQYHGSREYTDEPTLVTETRLKTAIDEGAILAIAHHPHVVQGFEIYRNKLIAYSMGNFIFDQYHYATQRSFLLYVWMDGEQFHRAEVMPLHIKGYVPMPATDTVRHSILSRVAELSGRRGVSVDTSGGNAVIQPNTTAKPTKIDLAMPGSPAHDGLTVWPLSQSTWDKNISSASLSEGQALPLFLGKNLLPAGHLESHYLNGAPDRAWIESEGQKIISDPTAPSGDKVMQLLVPAGENKGRIGMRTFEYTFKPGTPTTLVLKAKASEPATVIAYQQWRKKNEKRLEALKSAKLRPIGELKLKPGNWRELRFDFNSPRVTAISYRIILEVRPLDPSGGFEGRFDDISLVEWISPPLLAGKLPAHVNPTQTSHIGLAINPTASD